jgi:hypothetical protein
VPARPGPDGEGTPHRAPVGSSSMSKRTSKKKAKARRNKANKGRKPTTGR